MDRGEPSERVRRRGHGCSGGGATPSSAHALQTHLSIRTVERPVHLGNKRDVIEQTNDSKRTTGFRRFPLGCRQVPSKAVSAGMWGSRGTAMTVVMAGAEGSYVRRAEGTVAHTGVGQAGWRAV